MPVAERPARARDKTISMKFREKKNKVGRLLMLLLFGMLVAITSDAASVMFDCMKTCPPARRACVPIAVDQKRRAEASDFYEKIKKHLIPMGPVPEFNASFYKAAYAKMEKETGNITDSTFHTFHKMLISISWYLREKEADPTKNQNKSISKYRSIPKDVPVTVGNFRREYSLYKDQDAGEIFPSGDIAYNLKALFESAISVSSF